MLGERPSEQKRKNGHPEAGENDDQIDIPSSNADRRYKHDPNPKKNDAPELGKMPLHAASIYDRRG